MRSLIAISRTARENLAEARALVASGVPSDVQGGDLLATLKRLPDTLHLDSIRLKVTDNGQGFDVAAYHEGFGLKSMAARLYEIGGRLQVTSAPGTRTDFTMPGATA